MKNIILVILLLLTSIGTVEVVSARSIKSVKSTVEVFEPEELSLKQAIDLAHTSALKWDKKAQLLQAINIDLDKPAKSIGSIGKRKNLNVIYGVPDTHKTFLITIHDEKIDRKTDLTVEGTSPYPQNEFMRVEDINYDSPELLNKALKMGGIYPGKDWAKEYNFMLKKGIATNIPLVLVIGWDSDQKTMKAAGFNAKTGEYIPPQI